MIGNSFTSSLTNYEILVHGLSISWHRTLTKFVITGKLSHNGNVELHFSGFKSKLKDIALAIVHI